MATTSPCWYQRLTRLVQSESKNYPDFQIIEQQLYKHIPRSKSYRIQECHDAVEAGYLKPFAG
ncbi:hypothetical protein FF38_00158 [Lucilia cuprina]|uniref:Uncharacterized protein n=1 Tax=Lucilia cuprina TaxID=7375 RepID=A0A0L0BR50_LUCCU|nr:hypothetical protein FF38_00158 [Lucilia cuprina]